MLEVDVGALPVERFESVLPPDRYDEFMKAAAGARDLLEGRVVWNVNSTARGGGVAEMLRSLVAYAQGAGVDARWVVVDGTPDFFRITKRIHNHLHGSPGDGEELGDEEQEIYRSVLSEAASELAGTVGPDDIVILHDPQTAGLCAPAKEAAAKVIWRCHVGLDFPNDLSRSAWDFLRPHVEPADALVFSRKAFAWERLDLEKVIVIPPSIDAFSPKNQELTEQQVQSILAVSGLIDAAPRGIASFTRQDGRPGLVDRKTFFRDGGPPPGPRDRLVVQVSRWDRLKDPVGVIEGFARHIAPATDAHLVVAGPSVEAVADDPEGAQVLEESAAAWALLPADIAARVHLAALPMSDGEENAAIVNALQRAAEVVVQKSLAEGFGLTVAEGMWKARPVVASRIGGIQDQIIDGETGLLVDDPADLEEFGRDVRALLEDTPRAHAMGRAAQARVRDEFLGARHLMQYVKVIADLLGDTT